MAEAKSNPEGGERGGFKTDSHGRLGEKLERAASEGALRTGPKGNAERKKKKRGKAGSILEVDEGPDTANRHLDRKAGGKGKKSAEKTREGEKNS